MGVWYRAGTVAVTSGSKTVTGANTQWQNLIFGVAPGATFYGPDGKPYEIDTVNSNTSLTLVTNYSGTTASGQAYAIDPTRSGSVASLAAQTSEVLKFSQKQFTQIQTWFTGAANANVTLESPAGQTITVPSYLKVTSEGEGQATRAKAEADKAAASAASAAAAALAARLPTPDVSIPFSTDGRMTHGKGAPVLVGTTPVAQLVTYERLGSQTMIDKSGRLVTVPAGEMAIEQQGLAIFDQSVNLIAPSINWVGALTASPWVHSAKDPAGWITVSGAGSGAAAEGSFVEFDVPTADMAHTFSLDILKTAGMQVRIQVQDSSTGRPMITITESGVSGVGSGSVYDMGSFWRVELSFSFLSTTYRKFRIYPFGVAVGATGSMTYRRVQLEAKAFATPYIENTTSAKTTRPATTKCDIPWPGNMQPIDDNQQLTIALEFDTAALPSPGGERTVYAQGNGGAKYVTMRVESSGYLRIYRASLTHQSPVSPRLRYRVCVRINNNICDLFVDGAKSGATMTSLPNVKGFPDVLRIGYLPTPDRCLNGHLRSLNIWNASLTDIQCQAASS